MTIPESHKALLRTFVGALFADADLAARITDEVCSELAAHGEELPVTELYAAAVKNFEETRKIQKDTLTYKPFDGMQIYHRVPPTYRPAFVLVDMLRYRYDRAASVHGCKVGTIKSRVNRARASLKSEPAAAA